MPLLFRLVLTVLLALQLKGVPALAPAPDSPVRVLPATQPTATPVTPVPDGPATGIPVTPLPDGPVSPAHPTLPPLPANLLSRRPIVSAFTMAQTRGDYTAAGLIAIAKDQTDRAVAGGAQAIVRWDIETEDDGKFPGNKYVGDPLWLHRINPVMDSVADAIFAYDISKGLRTGLTIRASVYNPDTRLHTSLDSTVPAAIKVGVLAAKVEYAVNRWGITVVYIDSPDPWDLPAVLTALRTRFPAVVWLIEHRSVGVTTNQLTATGCADYIDGRNVALADLPALLKGLTGTSVFAVQDLSGADALHAYMAALVAAGQVAVLHYDQLAGVQDLVRGIPAREVVPSTPVRPVDAQAR